MSNNESPRAFALDECQLTIAEAANHLRISRAYLYKLIESKKIKPVKIGKRTLIQGREILRFMATLATAA